MAWKQIALPERPQPLSTGGSGQSSQEGMSLIPRTATRLATRLAEIPGIVGDIEEQVKKPVRFVAPEGTPEHIKKIFEGVANVPAMLPRILPTGQEIREFIKKTTGATEQDITPQNFLEKAGDVAVQNLGLGTLLGAPLGLRAIKIAAGQGLGKATAQEAGLGQTGQIVGELLGGAGAATAGQLWKARPQLEALKEQTYAKRDELLKGAKAPVGRLEHFINKARKDIAGIESKEVVKGILDDIEKTLSGNEISVKDALKWEDKIGKRLYSSDIPSSAKDAKRVLREVKQAFKDTAYDAQPFNREAFKYHEAADIIHQGLNPSDIIGKTLEYTTNPKKIFKSESAPYLLGGGIGASLLKGALPTAAKATALGASIAFPSRSVWRIGNAVLKDPAARKIYGNIFRDAAFDNGPALLKNVKKFDQIVSKHEKQIQKPAKKAGKWRKIELPINQGNRQQAPSSPLQNQETEQIGIHKGIQS